MKSTVIAFFIAVFCVSCDKKTEREPTASTDNIKRANERSDTEQNSFSKEVALKKTNDELLQALKVNYYDVFANYIHPQKGVRFSMYAFVNKNEDKHFAKADFEKYYPTKTVFT